MSSEHPLVVRLVDSGGGLRLRLAAAGVASFRPLVDTGSALTWLPARGLGRGPGLSLSGRSARSCRPTGSNFSIVYADGTHVAGVRCSTLLSLSARAACAGCGQTRLRWRQQIGAATTIREDPALAGAGESGAQRGVFSLSPAATSALWPLLRAVRDRPSITIAARSLELRVGLSVGGGMTEMRTPAPRSHPEDIRRVPSYPQARRPSASRRSAATGASTPASPSGGGERGGARQTPPALP
mmetsp:Transcript_47810/g.158405  ORF Transcript_47810/g.158405 Transcript_47810/m.158405 type:complete len:241 (-) Transcript_47810:342-1064(-)